MTFPWQHGYVPVTGEAILARASRQEPPSGPQIRILAIDQVRRVAGSTVLELDSIRADQDRTRSWATGLKMRRLSRIMPRVLPDLATEQDVKLLVDSFYQKVNADQLLSPIFNDLAQVDWKAHLPTMYSFWASLLLRTNSYQGRPWPKHAVLPVEVAHFTRWLALFRQTVDEHFSGSKAIEAKNIAASIADTFQNRLQLVR